MFSNILNFNPKPKKTGHCCVWASSADGRQQTELSNTLGRKVPFLKGLSYEIDFENVDEN
jgi:hypothetical protein